jgi:hypothetical protein
MNTTKTLIAAALLASAASAQAITQTDVILTLVDTNNSSSYNLDLGVSATAAEATPASLNVTINGASDANFASFISGITAGDNVFWRVDGSTTGNFLSTFVDSAINGYFTNNANGITNVNGASSGINTEHSFFVSATNSAWFSNAASGYAGASTNVGASEGPYTNSAAFGTNLNLWEAYKVGKTGVTTLNLETLNFSVDTTGANAVGTLAVPTVAAVPLPTSVWMFLSGVVGLLSLNRRKNSAV